ncbi:unnamed protein product [Gordionus sp. m RMFG-2023]
MILILSILLLLVDLSQQAGTIEPTPNFNPIADAKILGQALIGLGTDSNKLISVVGGRTNAERQEIAKEYKNLHKRDLVAHIKSDTNRKFQDALVGLMTPPGDYDAQIIRQSIKGFGTDFDILIEVMLTRTPQQIKAMRDAYRRLYKKDVTNSIKGDVRGYVEDLLVALSKGDRDESTNVDPAQALVDAKRLYQGGVQRSFGTDVKSFVDVLTKRNYAQLRLIFDQYQRISRHSIEEAIIKETSGKIQKSLLVLVEAIRNPASFFAKRLRHAMKSGFGTKDKDLIRILITRSEIDLEDIKNEYFKMYKSPLEKDIRNDVSGKYQDILVALVRGNRKPLMLSGFVIFDLIYLMYDVIHNCLCHLVSNRGDGILIRIELSMKGIGL